MYPAFCCVCLSTIDIAIDCCPYSRTTEMSINSKIVRAIDCGDYQVIGIVRANERGDCLVIGNLFRHLISETV